MFTAAISTSLAALTISATTMNPVSPNSTAMCPRPDVVQWQTPQQMLDRLIEEQAQPELMPDQPAISVDAFMAWAGEFADAVDAWIEDLRFYATIRSCKLCRG